MKRALLLGILMAMLLLRVNTVLGQSYIMTNGSTITTCSGTFYDPGGPNENYGSNSGFTQTFVSSNPNSCLQVTFTSLELEANYDKLLIYGTTTPTGTPIATLTGVQSNTTIVSFSNTMTFVFTSDGSVNKAGWEAVISCGDCPDPSSMHNGTETVYCSQVPISFYDPGGPSGNYGANQTFTQTFITSDPNKCLQVTFTSFETESDYDKLKVYYGTSASGNAFETYSGSIPNGFTITSYTDALTFQFISNDSIQKAGWVATVSCIDCADTCIPRSTNDGSPCSDETLAHPFCTDENPYGITYPSGTGSNNAHSTFFGISSGNVGCLYTTPRPAWYYMQIDQPGDLLIRIEQFDTAGVGRDVDFACWGPFSASSQSDFLEKLCCGKYLLYTTQQNSHHPTNGDHSNNATGGYPYGNLVDCSYSTSYTEWCFIPDAQQGEWYLLLMTNYSGQPGQITFNTVAEYSSATTNCNLLAPISYNAPLCEGDTLVLTCENPLTGAIYNWSGPGGWTAVTLVPSVSILNTTTSQSGQYNLQITGIDTTVLPSQVDVTIHAIPTVTLTVSSDHICKGNSVTLQASGAETYHWTSMSATGNSVTVTPASTTTYTVIGTNGGCADTATHLITVFYNSSRDTSVTVCDSLLWNGVYLYADTVLHDTLVNVHGCDSIVTLHLTVHHGTHHVETATACVSYVWHGKTYTESGTYTYAHENAEGCPSVDTLHLTIDHAEFVEFAETVCDEYVWNDETLTTSGDYTRTFTNSNGCDSIVTLRLTVNYGTHNVEFDTACRLYVWHDAVYTESGTYTYSYRNENGCLNVDTLHLIVNPIDITEFTESACEAYVWNDSVYTQSGHYKQIFTNANGCDSIVTLNLRIFEIEHQVYTVTACESYSWEMGDGQIYTTSGDYTYEYINDNGCTQMDTLHLTINNPVHHSSTVSAYDSYTWVEGDGNTYSVSGTYHHTHIDTNGCEQVDTLHLTIHYSSANDFAAVACESYEWDGVVYTTSGDYTRQYQDIYGADSTVTLHLFVRYGTHEVEYDTACVNFIWHGETYTTSGIYTYAYDNADGCPSTDTLHLTINTADLAEFAETVCGEYVWNNETFTTSGDYTRTFTNSHGCDSVVTLHLTVNYPTHTAITETAIDSYTWTAGNDSTYTQSGTYYYTHLDSNGCTQVDTLYLTIHYSTANEFSVTACESYEWDGVVYTTSGDYTRQYQDIYGADSTVTLHLVIRYGTHEVEYDTACVSYIWHGETYTTSGTYTYEYENADGCPSVDTLHLTVNYPTHTAVTETAFDSYTWTAGNDSTYTQSGTYYYTHPDTNECTQVDTLYLTIHYSSANDFAAVACESYEWDGVVYTVSGDYTRQYQDINGADSTVTLHLIVHYGTHEVEYDTACVSYVWHGENYTSSGTYTYEYDNADGCPSTDTLHLTINPADLAEFAETVCGEYVWNGETFSTSGDYTRTFTNSHGCDSVVTLHLTVNYPTHTAVTDTAFDSYTWTAGNGSTYTQSGTYYYTHLDSNGCTQVDTLYLTIHYSTANEFSVTACESYEWDGVVYTTSGDYTRQYQDINGADSTVTLHLIVHYGTYEVEFDTACVSYVWHGETYTSSGTYTYEYDNADGCPSTDTLHLTINPADLAEFAETVCGEYVWNNETFTTSGDYTRTFTNSHGCDSVVTLHLTVNYPTHTAITETAIDSYTWTAGNDSTYTQSGTYYYTHLDSNGCTQVDTLYLTIHYSTTHEFSITACESYEWDGVVFITSGDYTRQYQDIYGADSTVILHLVVHFGTHNTETETVCESYVWHGETYTVSGTYTYAYENADGCPSADTLHLTINPADLAEFAEAACEEYVWNGETFTTSGDYTRTFTNSHGCDSVVTLHLTVSSLSAEIDNITHVRCFNESTGAAEVTVSGGISPLTFQWTNESGATVSSTTALSNQPAGSYTFTVTDAIGCSDTVNITLNTLHQEMQAGTITGPSSLCSGDSLGWIHGTEAIGNGCAYQWQISAGNTNWNAAPGVNNTQNYNYNALATNDFKLRRAWISDECGTLYSNILEVEVVDTALRIITLTPDFCEEMSAELMMETFMTDYIWSTGEQTQHITVTNPGYYSVTATQNGCIASAGYLIEACESHLYLPNAITPGRGDGLNDYFCIPEGAKNDIALFEISIFNRWGEQVFYSTDMNFRWNGEYKGKIYHQNVYTYIIRYTNNVGKPYYVTGTITVL